MIELLEYVRRNGTLPGPSSIPLLTRGVVRVFPRPCCGWPREEPEEMVSSESVPCSRELDMTLGRGGTGSAGASIPFFVVETPREAENRPLALGADATRRIKRDADAPIALGDSGPERDVDCTGGRANEAWDGPAVRGFDRRVLGCRERGCFSGFVRALDLDEAATESASTDC